MDNETEQIFLLNPSELQTSGALQKVAETPATAQVNLENVEDFSTVCRLCATITEFVIPIFSGEGLQNSLADKIHKHLPIKVTEEDALPRGVCYQCAHTLLAWHELVKCCEQADLALRTRLEQLQKSTTESQDHNPRSDNLIENNQQKKFEEIARLVVPPPDKEPPSYPSSPAPPAPLAAPATPLTACMYCPTEHAAEDYRDHLIQAHTDLLFHCDECDTYVDRKDFILHMSFHVVQYSSGKSKEEPKKPKRDRKVKDENENTETDAKTFISESVNPAIIEESDPVTAIIEVQELNNDDGAEADNEFSDHSDTDFDFGPLPESVFEAIEDTQDSQPLNNEPVLTPHPIENKRIEKGFQNVVIEPDIDIRSELKSSENYEELPPESNIANQLKIPLEQDRQNHIQLPEMQNIVKKSNLENNIVNKEIPPVQDKVKKHKRIRTCPICGKVYTASSSYFYHMSTSHNKSREFGCELCGRKFGTKVILHQHLNTHSDAYDIECEICKKKFKTKSSLYIHKQNHIGEKTFSCDQCKISFRWRTHLMRHLKRHSAEKTHKCTTCGRGFTIRCDLLRHVRTHTAGKYECSKCGVSFAQVRYLKVHMDKKHSSVLAPSDAVAAAIPSQSEVTSVTSQGFC